MLGPHINWKSDQIEWVRKNKPRVGKVLLRNIDPAWMQAMKEASPSTFWVGRMIAVSQPLDDPTQNAKDFTAELLAVAEPYRATINALEGYNEVAVDGPEAMARYDEFENMRSYLLHLEGWKSVVGNFSAGTPEIELWDYFYSALISGDYLGLHEYSAPSMQSEETWLCLRYRRVFSKLPTNLRKPLIITECGIDGGMIGAPQEGWKSYTDPSGYLTQLRWYDNELQSDNGLWPIVGATIFCHGHVNPHWESFDIQGHMANDLLGIYMQANPPLPWKEPSVTDPFVEALEAEFGAEFDDIRDDLPQTGEFPRRATDVDYNVIHHTGLGTTAQTYSTTIARYHVDTNGWPAIGYHFLVYSHKIRYVGDIGTARAHVWGHNDDTVGIAIVGDYQEFRPSDNAILLARRLCDFMDEYYAGSTSRVGHREIALPGHETECPGDSAYGPDGWLREITDTKPTECEGQLAQAQMRIKELEAELELAMTKIGNLEEWKYSVIDFVCS
jgi:hypothetical protein